jgi:hypothetical protein
MIQLSKIMYEQYPKFLVDSILARKRLALAFESGDGETKSPFTPVSDQTSAIGHQKDAEKGETSEIAMKNQQIRDKKADGICETMTAKYTDFKESMLGELTNFIQSQARALSLADLDRLIIDLPALRERIAEIPLQRHAYLSDQLEFLCGFVEERVVGRSRDLAEEPVGEAAFALLYFHARD